MQGRKGFLCSPTTVVHGEICRRRTEDVPDRRIGQLPFVYVSRHGGRVHVEGGWWAGQRGLDALGREWRLSKVSKMKEQQRMMGGSHADAGTDRRRQAQTGIHGQWESTRGSFISRFAVEGEVVRLALSQRGLHQMRGAGRRSRRGSLRRCAAGCVMAGQMGRWTGLGMISAGDGRGHVKFHAWAHGRWYGSVEASQSVVGQD
jgi:hypothetical protein